MTYTKATIQDFLGEIFPLNQLTPATLTQLSQKSQLLRYRMGQPILVREKMPNQLSILYEGRARLLGYDPRNQQPVTLELLEPGAILGWVSLIRGIPCETAIASTETICLTLGGAEFLALMAREPSVVEAFQQRCSLIEAFELLAAELERQASGATHLKDLAKEACQNAVIRYLYPHTTAADPLEPDRIWFVSGGGMIANFPTGSQLNSNGSKKGFEVNGETPARIVGFRHIDWVETGHNTSLQEPQVSPVEQQITNSTDIPYASEHPPEATDSEPKQTGRSKRYPHVRGKGTLDSALACFQMISKHLEMPFKRDVVRRVMADQLARTGSLSLPLCGALADLMGLHAQLVSVPLSAVSRLQTPALVRWHEGFAVLYEANKREVVLGVPEIGIVRRKPMDLLDTLVPDGEGDSQSPESVQVLLVERTKQTPKQRFGLQWFLPSLYRYRKVLLEVFIASFFVQLFGLANPLMIQVIIDKVIVQNSIDTLHVLGLFLVVIAVFEALLTSLRTYLFVDTTNRIDMSLGSEIIDHLLRLPLRYFERRPVGELASRVNELENIRQFLTGTALTVVLDAVFSVVYIVVMFIYSWVLTLVALATIPLFVLLTVVVSPIVRSQLRTKAERNAQTQSYLVEVLSGIQTVKAQNIELRSRWQWQDRYARYVSAGFKTVLTSTTAGSASNFLNKLSALLVLWVGAYLVLEGNLTLGQLIAFRIISGYVTSPLLRLAQLWQNFQETALSLERLSDIVDSPQEAEEEDRNNIPMPAIKGAVKYENVSFRFGASGPWQLTNINLEFPAGIFMGIVGQSGSGKSTLMKLLPRLYELNSGRIFIDNYDISKVELYSLRRQIGIVPQDSLLFDGTVQDNIALTNPDATAEEIIEAAKIASAHDFIMGLPSGYNTRVGERGSALSGGQRQRVAIARTVLQNPELLILDEATSALDYETERQVCLNLIEAFRGRTVFFITHRLTTIRSSDIILMMDKGAVVEQGTHEELMALQGRYFCLYQQQEAQL
ncbi:MULTISPECIES: peptidase domain-containing ABC transporter [unclassified Coleofasciculus]|uniref:peptidase domain-containing ABC transporter n=1 Tax=unclassified Coleofasciculus TaxID=2692782 RepID=UPI0018822885|nr:MULTISPECIES: peptidase domain-containing ABC transporter [unclassified Coleofasciculus]MBE9129486.1 peptidase domain-containing ABC transporter [Coleofasciculus sp. LEGE 07081]MBE9148272.1 peptidase domain-containing ABC transporter [Coleofasciculus sp. LEGE 07092]